MATLVDFAEDRMKSDLLAKTRVRQVLSCTSDAVTFNLLRRKKVLLIIKIAFTFPE